MTAHDERAARLTHRIESFSDLVIGFSLALLALTLVIPAHAVDLIANPWWLIIYIWTFFVVVAIWWNHQRVFARYFVPAKLMIGLNFVLLSLVGLIVFFVQVFGHAHGSADKAVAFALYWIALGTEFAILGALFALGLRYRGPQLSDDERREGRMHAWRGLGLGAATYVGVAWLVFGPGPLAIENGYRVALPILIVILPLRLMRRIERAKVHA